LLAALSRNPRPLLLHPQAVDISLQSFPGVLKIEQCPACIKCPPTFYDKLLCVPALNLSVRALDRASDAVTRWPVNVRFSTLRWNVSWNTQQANIAYMGIWVGLLGLGKRSTARSHSIQVPSLPCQHGDGISCVTLGSLYLQGPRCSARPGSCVSVVSPVVCCRVAGLIYRQGYGTAKNEARAEKLLAQGCSAGFRLACRALQPQSVRPASAPH
jgi:hypothetical protein